MRCVAYIRVSTKELDENIQMSSIMEFSKSRGIEILEWYIDKVSAVRILFLRDLRLLDFFKISVN
jgi:DNA invertase Pin-like site-specific DNA recombinase